MPVPVDIFVTSDDLVPAPIEGVAVSAFDASSGLLASAADAVTDRAGKASFLLPGSPTGYVYELRFFKLGVFFGGPVGISVEEPATAPNVFDATGHVYTMPVASDPRACRCTGRFMNLGNKPIAGALVRINAKADSGLQVPKVVDANLISAESMELHTDANGYASFDLLRGAEYYVTFSGEDDVVWNIKVPDRSAVNLIDLIHPQPVSLEWDSTVAPGNALSLAVGDQAVVPMTMLFSDFEEKTEGHSRWLRLFSSDPSVATVVLAGDKAAVLGIAPGQASITASILDGIFPSRIPPYSLLVPPLVITVT